MALQTPAWGSVLSRRRSRATWSKIHICRTGHVRPGDIRACLLLPGGLVGGDTGWHLVGRSLSATYASGGYMLTHLVVDGGDLAPSERLGY